MTKRYPIAQVIREMRQRAAEFNPRQVEPQLVEIHDLLAWIHLLETGKHLSDTDLRALLESARAAPLHDATQAACEGAGATNAGGPVGEHGSPPDRAP